MPLFDAPTEIENLSDSGHLPQINRRRGSIHQGVKDRFLLPVIYIMTLTLSLLAIIIGRFLVSDVNNRSFPSAITKSYGVIVSLGLLIITVTCECLIRRDFRLCIMIIILTIVFGFSILLHTENERLNNKLEGRTVDECKALYDPCCASITTKLPDEKCKLARCDSNKDAMNCRINSDIIDLTFYIYISIVSICGLEILVTLVRFFRSRKRSRID